MQGSQPVIEWDEERQEARVRPLSDSYAGTMRGVFGEESEDVAAYLEAERQSWGEA